MTRIRQHWVNSAGRGDMVYYYTATFDCTQEYYLKIQQVTTVLGPPKKHKSHPVVWYHDNDKLEIYVRHFFHFSLIAPKFRCYFLEEELKPTPQEWMLKTFPKGNVVFARDRNCLVLVEEQDMVFATLALEGALI